MAATDAEINHTSYLSSNETRTVRPSARSVTLSLHAMNGGGGVRDVAEARYWTEKFGFGASHASNNNKSGGVGGVRSIQLDAGSAAIVHDIVMGTTAFAPSNNLNKAHHALLAVACGPRVPLYGTTPQSSFHRALNNKIKSSSISSAEIAADRHVPTSGLLATADGRLLAIGTHAGSIRVADTTTRATLCQFRYQSNNTSSSSSSSSVLPIRAIQWFRDGQRILAAGDDGTLRVFDLKQHNEGNAILECRGHGDAIRAVQMWQSSSSSAPSSTTAGRSPRQQHPERWVATGSYDHTVRLWNVDTAADQVVKEGSASIQLPSDNQDRCLAVLDHGAPVQALQWLKSTHPDVPAWLVSAGGTQLKVWNVRSGQCVFTMQAQHRKTITALLQMRRLNMDSDTVMMRLLTAGLDGLIRIHEWNAATGELRFLHGLKLSDGLPITALACSPGGDRFAIGTTDGTVLVRQVDYQNPSTTTRKKRPPQVGTYSFFQRGQSVPAAADDVVVGQQDSKRAKKLKPFDDALRQFRYGDALDDVLATRSPDAVIAVLEELSKRHGLVNALSNRDEETLEPVLSFIVRYITKPEYCSLLIGVSDLILDIYGDVAGQSDTIDELFLKLKRRIMDEVRVQKLLCRLSGQIDAAMSTMEVRASSETI
jgi:U3 small nucleolar RNA-associated protein 15